MSITTLKIANFRNITMAEINPALCGINVISGSNGSGKTSLLEAIYYLGHGRSFRTSKSSPMVQRNESKFSLFSQIVNELGHHISVGAERESNGAMRLRLHEQDASSQAALAFLLPLRVINSQSHNIFESGPAFRRKYLDWGLFYHTNAFLSCWRHFERALKQRNAVLRERRPKRELDPWTDEIIKYGVEFDRLRRDYIQQLAPCLNEAVRSLIPQFEIGIQYHSGWDEPLDYPEALRSKYDDDMRFGSTQIGPHRADLDLAIDSLSVKHFLSRGQQKLLICAMIVAQGMLLAKHANRRIIYLVDDLPAELDSESRQRLISLLAQQHTQVFISSIQQEMICDLMSDKPEVPLKVFHVEHGAVRPTHGNEISD